MRDAAPEIQVTLKAFTGRIPERGKARTWSAGRLKFSISERGNGLSATTRRMDVLTFQLTEMEFEFDVSTLPVKGIVSKPVKVNERESPEVKACPPNTMEKKKLDAYPALGVPTVAEAEQTP